MKILEHDIYIGDGLFMYTISILQMNVLTLSSSHKQVSIPE